MLFKRFAPLIVFLAGILFLVIGIISIVNQSSFTETKAVIEDIDIVYGIGDEADERNVMVTYVVGDHVYTSQLDSYNVSMKVGDELTVLYNPSNPSQVILKSALGPILFLSVGVLATLGGVVLFLKKGFSGR